MPPGTILQAGNGVSERIVLLDVIVNGGNSSTWPLLERFGMLYAPRDAFDEWRLLTPDISLAVNFRGSQYLPLAGIPGFTSKVNFSTQSIELNFSPQAFEATRLTTEPYKKPVLSPVLPSIFVNYDLNYATTAARGTTAAKELGILTEIGASNQWGLFTSTQVGRNLTGDIAPGTPRGWLRLESTFTKDFIESNNTLRLGDASTRTGLWGRNVYFGGIQFGSNFALTPGFTSQPSPVLSGVSTAPSTVELYVNDVLRQVSSVPTGPFAINNLPALTGSGEARLVVRDLLGRESIITQSFFTSNQLLAKGLSDWSIEAGRIRLDLGRASNHYGAGFTSGTWRFGLNDDLTVEGRSELTRKNQVLGFGIVTGLPLQILGKGAVVASHEKTSGTGFQWLMGLERQSLRTAAYLQAEGSSRDFRQLGQDASSLPTKLQVAGNFSYSTEKAGSFGLGFARLNRFDAPPVSTVSVNYSVRVGERSNLSMTASRAIAGVTGNAVSIMLVIPLDNNRVATASVAHRNGKQDFQVAAAQNPGFDENLGWRVLTGRQQGAARAEGGLYYVGQYGVLSGDLSTSKSQSALRLGTTGGFVLAVDRLFFTRRIDDSYAVAEVAGYGNVGIGLGSNVLTRTDKAGLALIPRMTAYHANSIRIDPRELPVSAEIDSIEQTVVPSRRSGVKVVFPVRGGRAALVKLVLDDGEPAPAGAVIQLEGDKKEFYVARRGEAFVTGLQPTNRLQLNWNNQRCQFSIVLPTESADEIVRVGPLSCRGVVR